MAPFIVFASVDLPPPPLKIMDDAEEAEFDKWADENADFSRENKIIDDYEKALNEADSSLKQNIARLYNELERRNGMKYLPVNARQFARIDDSIKAAVLRSALAKFAFDSLINEYKAELQAKSNATGRRIVLDDESGSSMHLHMGEYEYCIHQETCSLPNNLEVILFESEIFDNSRAVLYMREDISSNMVTIVDLVIRSTFDRRAQYIDTILVYTPLVKRFDEHRQYEKREDWFFRKYGRDALRNSDKYNIGPFPAMLVPSVIIDDVEEITRK